jgi:hypothetical protein
MMTTVTGSIGLLEVGKVYKVRHSTLNGDYLFLEGVVGGWKIDRFAMVSEDDATTFNSPSGRYTNAPALRQEKPCTTCGKPNDVGVHTCWNCGNTP